MEQLIFLIELICLLVYVALPYIVILYIVYAVCKRIFPKQIKRIYKKISDFIVGD